MCDAILVTYSTVSAYAIENKTDMFLFIFYYPILIKWVFAPALFK